MTTQIMITLNQIRKHDPSVESWSKLIKSNGGTKADLDKEFPVSSILDSNGLKDTLWALRCLPEYESLWRKFSWWTAAQVVDNANDYRVNQCLEVVKQYCEGLATAEELSAARLAALSGAELSVLSGAELSARSAALAAWSAALSAESAAESAALSAAWSARSAARSAESAAESVRLAQEARLRNILDTGEYYELASTF